MNGLTVFIDGIGLLGPGLPNWDESCPILRGEAPLVLAAPTLPAPMALPSAERRRVGLPVKLSMAVGFEAARHAGIDPALLPNVFSSTGGDCDNCHLILEALASDDRQISPTRFHNSVHNAPSGYWSIATGCREASTSLCAFDATFAAALLETASQACAYGKPCLLVGYDTAYPDPLYSIRPIPYTFGIGMVLSAQRSEHSLAQIRLSLGSDAPDTCEDPQMESLRTSLPCARSLPLLNRLAAGQHGTVTLDYLEGLSMRVELSA